MQLPSEPRPIPFPTATGTSMAGKQPLTTPRLRASPTDALESVRAALSGKIRAEIERPGMGPDGTAHASRSDASRGSRSG